MRKLIIFLSIISINCSVIFAQSPMTELADSLKAVETAYNAAKKVFEKDSTNEKAKIYMDSLRGEKEKAEQKLEKAEQEFKKLINGVYGNQINSLKAENEGASSERISVSSLYSWDKILLFSLAFLVIILFVIIIVDKKKRRDEILYILTGRKSDNGNPRLKEWENRIVEKAINKMKKDMAFVSDSKTANFETTRVIQDLQRRMAKLEDNNRKNQILKQTEPEIIRPVTPTSKTLYADTISNGMFNRVTEQPDEDTVYELFLKMSTDRTATFTVYERAYRRVLKNPDFIEGCDKQRLNQQADDLEIERGEAILQDNGKWQITQKAKVKFV